jgi:hypothetical protein
MERLRDGFSVEDLQDAIEGNHVSEFHCGGNDLRKHYHSLELIVRNSSKVQGFIEDWVAHCKHRDNERYRKADQARKDEQWRRERYEEVEQEGPTMRELLYKAMNESDN